MNMSDQNHDWLDDRLAVNNYIPDDGFTARVVTHLPEVRPDPGSVLRSRILLFSAITACGLLVTQVGPLVQEINHQVARYSIAGTQERFASLLMQPTVLLGGAGCIIVLAFASIPLLRRWA